ncbi:MAG: glycosyltransferase [Actinomycetota bacterium]|nr:glycosyltransferase [Actinomycetota bacterium]
MKFFAYTQPGIGHLYPIVEPLAELRRRGHDVTIMTLAEEVDRLSSYGFAAIPVDERVHDIPIEDWKKKTPLAALKDSVSALAARAAVEVPSVTHALEDHQPDVLFIDSTSWGAALVAEESGLPWLYAQHYPLPLPSRDAPPFGLGLKPRSDAVGRIRDGIAAQISLRALEKIVLNRLNPLRRQQGLAPFTSVDDVYLAAHELLAFTAPPFEYERSDWPDKIHMVGPGTWDPPTDAPGWLDEIEVPLILVGCSSQFQNDGKLVSAAVEAFGEDDDVHVVVTTAGVDPNEFGAPANFTIRSLVPHTPVLKRAACVVCHGGMGITQKALSFGVPVCAVPFGRDQFEVARRVESCGAGVRLPARRLNARSLRQSVAEARMKKARAESVAEELRSTGGPSAAADILERVAGIEKEHGRGNQSLTAL